MQTYFKYAIFIIEFINCISRYSIIPKKEVHISQSDILLAFFGELNSNFELKLDINSNTIARNCQIHLSTYKTTNINTISL